LKPSPRTAEAGGEAFDALNVITRPIAIQIASRLSGMDRHDPVLEVGYGNGRLAGLAQDALWTGIDLSVAAVSQSPKHYSCCAADMTSLPFQDGTFSALFSFSTLQYVDQEKALMEFARVLRPNGTLLLAENLRNNPVARLHRYTTASRAQRLGGTCETRRYLEPGNATISTLFKVDSVELYHLLAPSLFLLRPQPGQRVRTALANWTSKGVLRLDRAALANGLSRFAWMCLIVATRKPAAEAWRVNRPGELPI
jgi:SAM-dependent methyltransferase